MTRMFVGGRGGDDGGSGGNPIFSKYQKRSAKDAFIKKMKGIDDSKMTPQEKYQQNLDKKMADLRQKALYGGAANKFNMAGGGEEKKLSKSAEAFIRKLAEKQLKADEKKAMERSKVQIKAKYFTGMAGGKIDNKGRIYGANNRVIAKVNMKTGKVTNTWGTAICKYDANSPYCEHKISSYIANEAAKTQAAATAAASSNIWGSTGGSSGGMGSFYGHSDDSGNGGFWG